MNPNFTDEFVADVLGRGADLAGVADTADLQGLETRPRNLLRPFSRAISIAVRLPRAVFEAIEDRPTPIYANLYQSANRILDEIAFKTAVALEQKGFSGLPVPASQVLDRQTWHGAISHKAVARMAGLGWQGKNLLLITPEYGSRVRLVTVLTNAPLTPDRPMANRCGNCMECRDACPAGAIRGIGTDSHYQNREEALDFAKCVKKLTVDFTALPQVGSAVCGVCIKVCPFGRKTRRNE